MAMPFRLALLGLAHPHAPGLLRQIVEHPDEFALVGLHDPDPQVQAARRAEWEPQHGGLPWRTSIDGLLTEPADGVAVESPQHDNLRLARLALESGRPVLLEKPAGCDLAEHRAVVDLARRLGLHVQMLYLFRYMSAVQELLARARRGELGPIYHYAARLPKDLTLYAEHESELGRYAGGVFFEMAGHAIDLMVALLGAPRRVTPYLAHHHPTAPGRFTDDGLAVFEYDGAWATVSVPALEIVPAQRRFEVYGSDGGCIIPNLGSGHLANQPFQTLEVFRRGDAAWQRLDLPAATLQIRDLREFAAVVSGRKPPDFTLEHDLLVQRLLLEASGM
jgi:predicted dehydrogenase